PRLAGREQALQGAAFDDVIARQRDGQLRRHLGRRSYPCQDLQEGGRLPPRLGADAVGPHARRARPPRLLAPVPGGYPAGDRGRGVGAHWPPPSACGRVASSGEVPGAGGSALVTAASAGEPLTTPTGQTGSGNSTGGAAGGGTRSTSRRPS